MIKNLFKYSFYLFITGVIVIVGCNLIIHLYTKPQLFNSINDTPKHNVGLVLGTSKKVKGGRPNLFFCYRIEAAARLYKAGKIKYILVSGDNGDVTYNEPRDMQEALMAEGVPKDVIYLDYAGFRTFDSVIRCHKVFDQDDFLIISQEFHNKRAVFIARSNGMEVHGFNAATASAKYGMKTYAREVLARVLMMYDLLTGKEPKFLGEKVKIG